MHGSGDPGKPGGITSWFGLGLHVGGPGEGEHGGSMVVGGLVLGRVFGGHG